METLSVRLFIVHTRSLSYSSCIPPLINTLLSSEPRSDRSGTPTSERSSATSSCFTPSLDSRLSTIASLSTTGARYRRTNHTASRLHSPPPFLSFPSLLLRTLGNDDQHLAAAARHRYAPNSIFSVFFFIFTDIFLMTRRSDDPYTLSLTTPLLLPYLRTRLFSRDKPLYLSCLIRGWALLSLSAYQSYCVFSFFPLCAFSYPMASVIIQ
jgi:hypothetical protein